MLLLTFAPEGAVQSHGVTDWVKVSEGDHSGKDGLRLLQRTQGGFCPIGLGDEGLAAPFLVALTAPYANVS